MSELLLGVACVVLAYLLGSVPAGYLVGRSQRGIDIRRFGSGSTGTANVYRVLGWRASVIVFAADLAKTIAAVLLTRELTTGSAWFVSAAGVAALCGHCWPVHREWGGGRGAASSFGAMLVIQPYVAAASLLAAILTTGRTRYVSLGSLVGGAVGGIAMLALIAFGRAPVGDIIFTIGSPAIIFWRHRENIQRLLRGTERRFGDPAPEAGRTTGAREAT